MVLKIIQGTNTSENVTGRASDRTTGNTSGKSGQTEQNQSGRSESAGTVHPLDKSSLGEISPAQNSIGAELSENAAREQRLIKGARQFDQDALAEIYDLYSDELYYYALRKLGTPDLAEECVAELFSRFLQTLRRGKGPKDYLRAYLYRSAHNWVTSYYQRRPLPSSDIDDLQIPAEGNDADPFRGVALQQTQDQVRVAMAQLTPDQRQVIALKYLEGWKNQEIAEAIEKPLGAVKSLQHRALNALRRILLSDGGLLHE